MPALSPGEILGPMSGDDPGDETSGVVDEPLDDEFAARVIEQMYDLFIFPELARRGLPAERGSVQKALVTLPPDADVVVQLNDEALLAYRAATTRAIAAGEPVTLADIDPVTVTGLRPASVHPDAGWVALAEFPGIGVMVAFDFTRNRGRAGRLVDKAGAFHEQAMAALADGRTSPAIDLAFAACELAVAALMSLLSLDEPGGGRRNRHGRRSSWFAQWTRLGNSPREFHLLLTRLAELRPRARYGDTDPVPAEDIAVLLGEVDALLTHARERVGEPLPDVPGLEAFAAGGRHYPS